jgi:hypothetical protein
VDSAPAAGGRDGGRRLAPLRRRRSHPGLPVADPPHRHPRTSLPSSLNPAPPPPSSSPPPLAAVLTPCPPLSCAGVHPGAGRRRLLLRAHPQDRMHALVSRFSPPVSHPLRFSRDLRVELTGSTFWISAAGWRGRPCQTPSSRTPTRSTRYYLVPRVEAVSGCVMSCTIGACSFPCVNCCRFPARQFLILLRSTFP